MFGNESKPCRIYSYGARTPMEGLEAIDEQIFKAHQYRNDLVRLERDRRALVDASLAKQSPKLKAREDAIEKLDAEYQVVVSKVAAENAKARKKLRDPETTQKIKGLQSQLKALRSERKEMRKTLFASAQWKATQEKIEESINLEKKALRAACGVYWGTYLCVEQSMGNARVGAPPKFHRFTGEGKIAVQIQGGMSPAEALSGTDGRLRLELHPKGVWIPGRKAEHPRKLGDAILRLRIGTVEGTRNPIFAKIPFYLHRPLPEGSSIKWAWLTKRKIGTKYELKVQFVLARDSWDRDDVHGAQGAVGIDLGWRLMEPTDWEIETSLRGFEKRLKAAGKPLKIDPSLVFKNAQRLRVAVWHGSDGVSGELALPPGWVAQMRKVEDIRSIRDKNFDSALADLVAWTSGKKGPEWLTATLPGWFTAATSPAPEIADGEEQKRPPRPSLPQWRSAARLASLVLKWKKARFQGDTVAYGMLEGWRLRDLHLLEYEANLRDQLQKQRLDLYRNFAAKMRRIYKTAYVEEMDLRDFHVLPPVAETDQEREVRNGRGETTVAKLHARDAALSFLRQCLEGSMDVQKVAAGYSTKDCASCGTENEWDQAKALENTCSGCGETWDQDMNAAKNLLARGLESGTAISSAKPAKG